MHRKLIRLVQLVGVVHDVAQGSAVGTNQNRQSVAPEVIGRPPRSSKPSSVSDTTSKQAGQHLAKIGRRNSAASKVPWHHGNKPLEGFGRDVSPIRASNLRWPIRIHAGQRPRAKQEAPATRESHRGQSGGGSSPRSLSHWPTLGASLAAGSPTLFSTASGVVGLAAGPSASLRNTDFE